MGLFLLLLFWPEPLITAPLFVSFILSYKEKRSEPNVLLLLLPNSNYKFVLLITPLRMRYLEGQH